MKLDHCESAKSKVPCKLVVLVSKGDHAVRLELVSTTQVRSGLAETRNRATPPENGKGLKMRGAARALYRFRRPPVAHLPAKAVTGSVAASKRPIIC